MANGEHEMKRAGEGVAGKARDEASSRKGPAGTQQKELQRKGKAITETKARKRKAPFVL
jgi:hypothetical protein